MPLDDATLAILGHLNRIEFGRTMARWSGPDGRIVEEGGVLLYAAATDFPVQFNGVYRLDRSVSASEVMDRAERFFGGLGRGYTVDLRVGHPDDQDLLAAAEAAGLVALTGSPEMVVRGPVDERPVPDGVSLQWVEDGASVDDFVRINDEAYVSLGMTAGSMAAAFTSAEAISSPECRTVVATFDGTPVATAMTLLSHGIAGVYCVATLQAARGRGLADLVTRAVTNRSFDEGARASTLQASAMGERIYERMGYRALYRYSGLISFGRRPER